jgi:hypothetical protein
MQCFLNKKAELPFKGGLAFFIGGKKISSLFDLNSHSLHGQIKEVTNVIA